ncbi:hypothetical protein [Massilia antarctica]|uniref:hypothetical protein n=1 Tax=Massilia antarctica TaxID=2765360 RepID=UPI0006BB57A5|nr:hypothetical protein [Massilia sp. H27-R4]MCY0912711.1 hypothetical protein [Massilia sp. H27-R4]
MNDSEEVPMIPELSAGGALTQQIACRRCFQAASVALDYGDVYGKLRSSEWFHCPHCGLTWESDDIGFLQPEPRARMLAAHGEWVVRMVRTKPAFNAVKVLRTALELDLLAAYALLKHESGIVFTGAIQECLWLKRLLERAGESPVVARRP